MRDVARFVMGSMADAALGSSAFDNVKITGRSGGYYTAEYRGQTISVPIGDTDVADQSWLRVIRRGGVFEAVSVAGHSGGE